MKILKDTNSMIAFLARDEYRFRPGYRKEYYWHHLKQQELTAAQKHRLQNIALNYLQQRMRREFWYMCRCLQPIADEGFRQQVWQLTNSPDGAISKRASLLNEYLKGAEKGEEERKKFKMECRDQKYKHLFGAIYT